jgi:hypothetical protein
MRLLVLRGSAVEGASIVTSKARITSVLGLRVDAPITDTVRGQYLVYP